MFKKRNNITFRRDAVTCTLSRSLEHHLKFSLKTPSLFARARNEFAQQTHRASGDKKLLRLLSLSGGSKHAHFHKPCLAKHEKSAKFGRKTENKSPLV
jgi:hypothetical protein